MHFTHLLPLFALLSSSYVGSYLNDTNACMARGKNGSHTVIQCCPDFIWNGEICTECPAGTYRDRCKEKCLPGYFGVRCMEICNCSTHGVCDPVEGCVCINGWTGVNCAEASQDSLCKQDILRKNTVTLIVVSLFGSLVMLLLSIGLILYYKRRQRINEASTDTPCHNPYDEIIPYREIPVRQNTNDIPNLKDTKIYSNRGRRWSSPPLLYIEGNTAKINNGLLITPDNEATNQTLYCNAGQYAPPRVYENVSHPAGNGTYIAIHPYAVVHKKSQREWE